MAAAVTVAAVIVTVIVEVAVRVRVRVIVITEVIMMCNKTGVPSFAIWPGIHVAFSPEDQTHLIWCLMTDDECYNVIDA